MLENPKALSTLALIMLVTTIALMGCAEDGQSTNACQQAASHIADCTGASSDLGMTGCTTDEAAAAEQLLGLSCQDIDTADAKNDFWGSGNPLCIFMTGAKKVGERGLCCFDYNCEGELVCSDYRCTARSEAGASCERNSHCEGDLVCTQNKTCGEASTQGGGCTSDSQCSDALHCIAEVCTQAAAPGEACDADEDYDCQSGLRCEGGVCVELAETGAACAEDKDCEGFMACIQGQCARSSQEGGPCDIGDMFDCDFNLSCVANVCVPEPSEGEACEADPVSMCGRDMICWEGVCEPAHQSGEPCNSLFDCGDGLFCIDEVCKSS